MANQNYYELLGVAPAATATEIEFACDALYNKWRALVNHPDQQVVVQANQALHSVETIRATLADPARREAYDMGIGLKGAVSGLADPTALLQQPGLPRTPPTPGQGRPDAIPTTRVDSWACPQCGTVNPVGTRFCTKCGNALSTTCANCGQLAEVGTVYCPSCGVSLKEAAQAKEARDRDAEEQRRREAQRQAALQPIIDLSQSASTWRTGGYWLLLLFPPASPFVCWQAMSRAKKALAFPTVPGDTEYRNRALSALKWSRGLFIFWVLYLVGGLIALLNYVMTQG